ncbi:MAG: DUF1540 domain-containing protein [Halanaerobiales bacterium]
MYKLAKIKCTVDNCYYWDSGDICAAEAIEVAKNFFGDDKMETGSFGAEPSMSNQTKCVTFRPAKVKN